MRSLTQIRRRIMRAIELFPRRVAVFDDLQGFDDARPAPHIVGFPGPQPALRGPLLETTNSLLELLRPDLNPRFEDAVILVALAPGLEMEGLQQQHRLDPFQRANAAVPLQY